MAERYTRRSREGLEHDTAGVLMVAFLFVLGLGLFDAVMVYGLLGFTISALGAAALTLIVLVLLVLAVAGWEMTKEPGKG